MTGFYVVLMCGDRHWTKAGPIRRELRRLLTRHPRDKLIVVEGEAPGADQMCRWEAEKMGIHVARVSALWDHYHNAAGPKRNDVMLVLNIDEVIGFHENIGNSKGTKDTLTKARKRGLKWKLVER